MEWLLSGVLENVDVCAKCNREKTEIQSLQSLRTRRTSEGRADGLKDSVFEAILYGVL